MVVESDQTPIQIVDALQDVEDMRSHLTVPSLTGNVLPMAVTPFKLEVHGTAIRAMCDFDLHFASVVIASVRSA
jgi:hypothetical protein